MFANVHMYISLILILQVFIADILSPFPQAGHFFAARLQGIHVSQFSIGMGPAIWSYKARRASEFFFVVLRA